MRILIDVDKTNQFQLMDLLHISYGDIKANWVTITTEKKNELAEAEELDCIQVMLDIKEDDQNYEKRAKFEKIVDTLKIAYKLGVIR